MDRGRLERGRQRVAAARSLVALTGAGVSAESGVPTFRGEEALWERFRPEELATPQAFRDDPVRVWRWYAWRRDRVARSAPNAAHRALARVAAAGRLTIVTQNVDGLHGLAADELDAEADRSRARPLELHGSLFRVRCTGCDRRRPHREPLRVEDASTLPRCRSCGALLRPDVVWFGEPLDASLLETAYEAAAAADLCLVVGTSAVVHPAAGIATVTVRAGGELLEVNPEATPLSAIATISLRAPAAEAVPALLVGS